MVEEGMCDNCHGDVELLGDEYSCVNCNKSFTSKEYKALRKEWQKRRLIMQRKKRSKRTHDDIPDEPEKKEEVDDDMFDREVE